MLLYLRYATLRSFSEFSASTLGTGLSAVVRESFDQQIQRLPLRYRWVPDVVVCLLREEPWPNLFLYCDLPLATPSPATVVFRWALELQCRS